MARYGVLLADPPWRYYHAAHWGLRRHGGTAPTEHYATMTIPQICALPVGELVAEDAALFLWVTAPVLPECLSVLAAWGFRYVTVAFTWAKVNRDGSPFLGLGAYTRANAEVCLLGLRGKLRPQAHDVSQLILSRPREHSRKPDEQYGRIERLFAGPYCELFARQRWPGWDAWGLEVGKFPAQPFLFQEFPGRSRQPGQPGQPEQDEPQTESA